MTKVMSNLVSRECKNFRELRKNNFHSKNYTPLNGSKSLNYYDIDGYDHNSDNLKQDNLSLKYLTINCQNYSELTILVVNRTKIKQINEAFFRHMPNLVEIDFSFNKIEHIEENTFGHQKKLEKIFLSQNHLRKVRANTFEHLAALTLIDLHHNEISVIETNAFIKLPNLNRLLLSFNELTEIKSEIFEHLPKLEEIDFHYNKISSCEFSSMSNLKKLDLSRNRLKRITKDTFRDLSNLKELNLTLNEIEQVELGSFSQNLPQMETCDLRSNARLRQVDFLVLSLAEKKINFDEHVRLIEYSRLSIETLMYLFSFYSNIECYHSKAKGIVFKLRSSLFISVDVDDFNFQSDHIFSSMFFSRKFQQKVISSFWIHVYDLNKRVRNARNSNYQNDSDFEVKEFILRFKPENLEQLKKILSDVSNPNETNYKRSNSNGSKSQETYKIFFKSLRELQMIV
jgi:Leucine-rich repeat (LRR) protein